MNLEEVIKGIDHHQWSSEPDVAEFIASLIKMHKYKDVVEIGVFKGFTSSHIISALPNGGTYIGIDMFDHRAESVKEFMKEKDQTFLLGDSKKELERLASDSADLIFLDGDHSLPYVKAEFLESLRIIHKNGIICIHDYSSPGVKTWVDFIAKFGRFDSMVFNTSENRGMAAIRCKKPSKKFSSLTMGWFNLTRSDFAIKVRDKLRSIERKLTGKKQS